MAKVEGKADAGFMAMRKAGMAKQSTAVTDDTDRAEAEALSVGQRVRSKASGKAGTIRFIGPVAPLPKGVWCGVELDEPTGKNDGLVKGVRLFTCGENRGAVLRPSTVEPEGIFAEDKDDAEM